MALSLLKKSVNFTAGIWHDVTQRHDEYTWNNLKRLNDGNQQSAKHVTSNLGNFILWRKVDV